jgi:predicted dehydrogenase
VGIVGLGMAVAPHAKSLIDLQNRAEVAYAFSPSAARREKFASQFKFNLCERLETILEDRSVGAVLILTPPNTHLELAERCAAAGKHVLLEKPLEISTARAERMVEIFSKKKLKLGIVLQHRFRPAAEKLREMLPELGKIVSASAMIPNWRPQSYYDQPGRGTSGVLLTQGIHTLDLFLSYTGEAAEARSFTATTPVHRMEAEDLACAAVKFKSGALGVIHATTTAYPGFPERIELIGTQGTALLEGTSLKANLQGKPAIHFSTDAGGGGTGADPMAFPHDWHRGVLADFLDAVEKNREPRVSGAEGLKVHRFIDQLLQTR